jgi:hypothetical protein
MESISPGVATVIVLGAVIWAAHELYTQRNIDSVQDKGAAGIIIPEEKIDIDNIDRLSRYAKREEYKNSAVLSLLVGGNPTTVGKLNSILQINNNIKATNFNYMVSELARDDYNDSSTEQWRKKIFSEYVFQ